MPYRHNLRIRLFIRAAASTALLAALVVLLGWTLGVRQLTSFGRAWTPMVVATALVILLGGLAVLLKVSTLARETVRPMIRAAGAGVLAISASVIVNIVAERTNRALPFFAGPGWRMAPTTAAACVALGVGMVLVTFGGRLLRAAETLFAIALVISLYLLLTFAFGAAPLSDLMGAVRMSPITASGLVLLAGAWIMAVPEGWLVRVVSSDEPGSRVARVLLPVAVAVPLALGFVRLAAYRAGVMSVEYGIAMLVLSAIVLVTLAILWGALRVNRDAAALSRELQARNAAEASLRALTAELEQRVAERTVALAAANRELEAFSYSVSHDLRTPLRALDGFSQALLEDYASRLDDAGRDYLDRIRRGSQRMAALIDSLLDLSKVSRGQLQRQPVDLTATAREIIDGLRQAQPDRAVDVTVEEGLEVVGDPALLRALLQNLLVNAWKFTARRENARIEFVSRSNGRDGGRRVFVVRDNGAGFDMAYASKLFGAFQRLHTDREFEGTGVGLATAQRIVHRHGGDIRAEGKPGVGATFEFTID